MGLVKYVIYTSGNQLFNIVRGNLESTELKYFDSYNHYIKHSYEPETKLFGEEIALTIESKSVSIITLFVKYLRILTVKEELMKVRSFENKIQLLFQNLTVYRVDSSLIESYQTIIGGEYWYKHRESSEMFRRWLQEQEYAHWSIIKTVN